MDLEFRPLGPNTMDRFVAMHARPECQGCFCMYWQYEGDNRSWQLRTGEENEREKRARVEQGRTHGMLALRDGETVGTIQFEPRASLSKLTARMPYRALGDDADVWSIACLRVLEAERRRGVARALLRAALVHLRETHGARAVEAYPRRGEDLRDEEVWTGPEALFLSEGFVTVRDHTQYPVLRREWDSSASPSGGR